MEIVINPIKLAGKLLRPFLRVENRGRNNSLDLRAAKTPLLQYRVSIQGNDNTLQMGPADKFRVSIEGNGNVVQVSPKARCENLILNICGDHNTVVIEEGVHLQNTVTIDIGYSWHNACHGAKMSIGRASLIHGLKVVILEPESEVSIGSECLFSDDIEIWASDTHAITDLDGQLLNHGGRVVIGDRVWLGRSVKIGKKAQISRNSVVGRNSIVSSQFSEENIVIAGNPAKKVKEGILWDARSPETYRQQKSPH